MKIEHRHDYRLTHSGSWVCGCGFVYGKPSVLASLKAQEAMRRDAQILVTIKHINAMCRRV